MGNKTKIWGIAILVILGIILGIGFGVYTYQSGEISDTNIVNVQRLAETENEQILDNSVSLNETIETSSISTKVSPNAIVIEKRYYQSCDHLIREVVDIPERLVNQSENEVKEYYKDWKVEGYSAGEIVIYKEFKGICNEHYVVKEHNGILAIYTEDDKGVQEWKEDTEIEVQYLPEKDIEQFKVRNESGRKNKFE